MMATLTCSLAGRRRAGPLVRQVLLCLSLLLLHGTPPDTAGAPAGLTLPGSVDIDWHFRGETLSLDSGLPAGTVVAVARIPEGRVVLLPPARTYRGIWSLKGMRQDYQMADTNLPGLMVRVVPEKMTGDNSGHDRPPAAALHAGGFRIELVSTGPVSAGVLVSVRTPLEFRVYGAGRSRPPLLLRERLHYDGALKLRVGPGAAVPDRASWRDGARTQAG